MSENNQLYAIYSYIQGIYNYEQFLKNIYQKSIFSNTEEFQGYLINLSDYDNFKKGICYDKILNRNNGSINFSEGEFSNLINEYEISISNIKKVELINISNPEELINLIKNGYSFKLIDKNLCELICLINQFDSIKYSYYINTNNLEFLNVSFAHNNNNLDEYSYIIVNEELINLSNSIIEYYNIESQFKGNISKFRQIKKLN